VKKGLNMKFKRPRPKKRLHQINEEIRASQVRLIDENKAQLGIVVIAEALNIARGKGLDLVAISPDADPPVCRLLDYGKYLYSLQKKAHEAQKSQRKVHIKEIKFTPVIGDHDVEVKLKKIKQFLEDGNKVKITIWLKGRQKRRPEMLGQMTDRIMAILTEISEIESPPKRERWSCHILIGKKKGDKDAKAQNS
jgi:translation initiation factor IF-3